MATAEVATAEVVAGGGFDVVAWGLTGGRAEGEPEQGKMALRNVAVFPLKPPVPLEMDVLLV